MLSASVWWDDYTSNTRKCVCLFSPNMLDIVKRHHQCLLMNLKPRHEIRLDFMWWLMQTFFSDVDLAERLTDEMSFDTSCLRKVLFYGQFFQHVVLYMKSRMTNVRRIYGTGQNRGEVLPATAWHLVLRCIYLNERLLLFIFFYKNVFNRLCLRDTKFQRTFTRLASCFPKSHAGGFFFTFRY